MNIENLYQYFPSFFQNLLINLKSYILVNYRYSKQFQKLLRDYQSRTFYSRNQTEDYRTDQLNRFIGLISKNNFYRNSSRIELAQFPIITKEDVLANISEIVSEVKETTKTAHTSGTTGAGLIFPVTQIAEQAQWAVWWRYRDWHGINRNMWCAYFGGRKIVPIKQQKPPYWRTSFPSKQIMFSAYHLNNSTFRYYLNKIEEKSIKWLHGYPSIISTLANMILENEIDFRNRVSKITTGAENLMPHQVTVIEKAFGIKPVQHYGQAEGVANISECPNRKLHVDEDYSYVEFILTNEENIYRIIGTNLTNYAFPLVRYDTGDLVEYHPEDTCDCGRPGRVVKRIEGRNEDYVVLSDGTKIGRLDHIFKDMTNIKEAQIYQRRKGEIEINVVKRKSFVKKDEKLLINEVKSYLGDIKFQVNYFDSIPKTKSGKLKFVISEIGKN